VAVLNSRGVANCSASHHSSDGQDFVQCLLLPYGAIPVFPATLKEAMTHHALAKEKKDDRQDDYKQELSNSDQRADF